MGKIEAEAELNQLKQLIEAITAISERAQKMNLHDAEMSLEGNLGNPGALDNTERNLRKFEGSDLVRTGGLASLWHQNAKLTVPNFVPTSIPDLLRRIAMRLHGTPSSTATCDTPSHLVVFRASY
jgi:hypothetical protein